jgi:arylsulfatase
MGQQNGNQYRQVQREILPIPDVVSVRLTTYDAKDPDTRYPSIELLRPPKGALNILFILVDHVGFGSSSTFGGPCESPNLEKLASNGLRYNRFQTSVLCSPTQAALLTGCSHLSVGMGAITRFATGAPDNNSIRLNTAAPLTEILKLNGCSTAQFGKGYEVPVWEMTYIEPFNSWPTGSSTLGGIIYCTPVNLAIGSPPSFNLASNIQSQVLS